MRANCIRLFGNDESPCHGHSCAACDKTFYCGEPPHRCTPRPERSEAGVVRRQSLVERLADGWKMIDDDRD